MAPVKVPLPPIGHQALDAVVYQLVESLLPPFLGHELLAAGRLENGAAFLHGVRYRGRIQTHELALNHATVAAHNAVYLNAVIRGRAHYGPNSRVHARRIAATGKYSNSLHLTFFKANRHTGGAQIPQSWRNECKPAALFLEYLVASRLSFFYVSRRP
jgi:hypothetical protein